MPYQYNKKRKYRLKPIPILTAILILLLLFFIVLLFVRFSGKKATPESINGNVSTQSIQETTKTSSKATEKTSTQTAEISSVAEEISSTQETVTTPLTPIIPQTITNTYDSLILNDTKQDTILWNLILLNQSHYIEKEVKFDNMKFDNEYLDKRAGEYYEKMVAKAKEDGISLFLRSGYRTLRLQKSYYDANVNLYMEQGNSKEKAEELTRLYYTQPGHSEHHSGLGADIITRQYQNEVTVLDERFAATDGYKWLLKNCSDYGFILRYPKEKQKITTVNFEPWHYRYVGIEHAKAIQKSGMCLEEYMESMNLTFQESVKGQDLTAEQRLDKFVAFATEFAKMF